MQKAIEPFRKLLREFMDPLVAIVKKVRQPEPVVAELPSVDDLVQAAAGHEEQSTQPDNDLPGDEDYQRTRRAVRLPAPITAELPMEDQLPSVEELVQTAASLQPEPIQPDEDLDPNRGYRSASKFAHKVPEKPKDVAESAPSTTNPEREKPLQEPPSPPKPGGGFRRH